MEFGVSDSSIVVKLLVIIACVFSLRELVHLVSYTAPQQLVQLVKNAHSQRPIPTQWNIRVSSRMRELLCSPLTLKQQLYLCESGDDIVSKSVSCYLLSHKYRPNRLSGIVNVSIQIISKSGKCDINCTNKKLRITIKQKGIVGSSYWEVEEVEILSG